MDGIYMLSRDHKSGIKVEWYSDLQTLCVRLDVMFTELGRRVNPSIERALRRHVARNLNTSTMYLNLMEPFTGSSPSFDITFVPYDLEF
jgi:hypothetical protein